MKTTEPVSKPDEGITIEDYRELVYFMSLFVQDTYDALDYLGYMQPTIERMEREAAQLDADGKVGGEFTRRMSCDQLGVISTWAYNAAEAKQQREEATVCTGNGEEGGDDDG